MDPVNRRRRRSADDSPIIGLFESINTNDDLKNIENIDELKDKIRSLRKYIQQLQMRVRTNTSDVTELSEIEKLHDQIKVTI